MYAISGDKMLPSEVAWTGMSNESILLAPGIWRTKTKILMKLFEIIAAIPYIF